MEHGARAGTGTPEDGWVYPGVAWPGTRPDGSPLPSTIFHIPSPKAPTGPSWPFGLELSRIDLTNVESEVNPAGQGQS